MASGSFFDTFRWLRRWLGAKQATAVTYPQVRAEATIVPDHLFAETVKDHAEGTIVPDHLYGEFV